MLQHDRQLKIIADKIEKRIQSELEKMLRMIVKNMKNFLRALDYS